jgi:hypothetical protein
MADVEVTVRECFAYFAPGQRSGSRAFPVSCDGGVEGCCKRTCHAGDVMRRSRFCAGMKGRQCIACRSHSLSTSRDQGTLAVTELVILNHGTESEGIG